MPQINFGKKAGKAASIRKSTTGTAGALTAPKKPVGRPVGTTNKDSKTYRDILLMHLKRDCPVSGVVEGRPVVEHVICAQIAAALGGNVVAQNSIIDRMFGKIEAGIKLSGDAENPLEVIQKIAHVFIDRQVVPPSNEVSGAFEVLQ